MNLILERPLMEVRIKAYQMQLKSMKFYDGALTGKLDEETLRPLASGMNIGLNLTRPNQSRRGQR